MTSEEVEDVIERLKGFVRSDIRYQTRTDSVEMDTYLQGRIEGWKTCLWMLGDSTLEG